jgi:anti-sigma factor RsiW
MRLKMSSTEHDVELLEQYLDAELPTDQAEQLRLRAGSDPTLNATMQRLRQQRALRREGFGALEPSPDQVDALLARIDRAVAQHRVWTLRTIALRRITAAAACVLVGVGVGWMGRSTLVNDDFRLPERTAHSAISGTNTISQPLVGQYPAYSTTQRSHPWADADGYKVAITDAFGRVIAIQRFKCLHEAMEFSKARDELPTRTTPFDRLPPVLKDPF